MCNELHSHKKRKRCVCCQATEEEHEDRQCLLAAISAMTDVAHAINEYKRRKDLGRCRFSDTFHH